MCRPKPWKRSFRLSGGGSGGPAAGERDAPGLENLESCHAEPGGQPQPRLSVFDASAAPYNGCEQRCLVISWRQELVLTVRAAERCRLPWRGPTLQPAAAGVRLAAAAATHASVLGEPDSLLGCRIATAVT